MVNPLPSKRGRRYWLRLLAFFLTIIVILPLLIILVTANATALSYIVPAHTTIVRPTDLPSNTQDVSFIGGDNLTLHGWYIPSQNNTVIILLHGYFADRTQMLFQAQHLTQAGYGVLLYDERGAGESDGSQRSFGWRDVNDVGGALAFLKDKAASFAIVGCSIGGQIALRATAQYPQLRAVLADGPSIVSVDDMPSAADWATHLCFVMIGLLIACLSFMWVCLPRLLSWRPSVKSPRAPSCSLRVRLVMRKRIYACINKPLAPMPNYGKFPLPPTAMAQRSPLPNMLAEC